MWGVVCVLSLLGLLVSSAEDQIAKESQSVRESAGYCCHTIVLLSQVTRVTSDLTRDW